MERNRTCLAVDTKLASTSGKRANKDRTPNSVGNAPKKPSITDKFMAAATGIMDMAAPRQPTEDIEQSSWIGDELGLEVTPKYQQHKKREEKQKEKRNNNGQEKLPKYEEDENRSI